MSPFTIKAIGGFTLIELAIVLLIIGALAGSILVPLSSSFELRLRVQSRDQLALIKQGLIGFTANHGYLPCPITLLAHTRSVKALSTERAKNVDANTRTCHLNAGGVPAARLGVAGAVNEQGALLDVWGRPYIYHVSDMAFAGNTYAEKAENQTSANWLSSDGVVTHTVKQLRSSISLCRRAKNVQCRSQDLMTSDLVWLVLTQAGHALSRNPAEKENLDQDNLFVEQDFSQSQTNAFDDQLVWASQSEMVYWLLKANWFQ